MGPSQVKYGVQRLPMPSTRSGANTPEYQPGTEPQSWPTNTAFSIRNASSRPVRSATRFLVL